MSGLNSNVPLFKNDVAMYPPITKAMISPIPLNILPAIFSASDFFFLSSSIISPLIFFFTVIVYKYISFFTNKIRNFINILKKTQIKPKYMNIFSKKCLKCLVKVKNCDNLIVRCNKCGGYDMQMFLLQIASRMMGLLAGVGLLATDTEGITNVNQFYNTVFEPVVGILDSMLVPILILIGTAGSIYAIILGVNFSKAESSDKREEAKKRMINAIIGLVVTILLLILLKLFTANAQAIADWINSFNA